MYTLNFNRQNNDKKRKKETAMTTNVYDPWWKIDL